MKGENTQRIHNQKENNSNYETDKGQETRKLIWKK